MDREIADDVRSRSRRTLALKVAVPVALVAAAAVWLPGLIRPSVNLSRIRTAIVTTGPMNASISAAGLVVPALERVVSSPLDARVLRVLLRPGATVARGDAVLQLDVSESLQALDRAENDLKVKDNEQQQTRLGYEKALVELDGRIEIKGLDIESRRATLESHRQLAGLGLLSKEELRRSELALRQAEIELTQLEGDRSNAARTTAVRLEGLALERSTLLRDAAERRRLLDLATTKSDRDGVLTWIVAEEGVLVRRGDVIARIADLSSFRIDASASDIHSGRIRTGLPVAIQIDDTQLDGMVAEVYPTVENGTIRFMVTLSDAGDVALRPSLRADVQVITDRKPQVLKVGRGPFAEGTGAQQVFVRRGNRAVRTAVTLGVASFDEVEVVAGLAVGDEVIVSDMRDYIHLSELRVR